MIHLGTKRLETERLILRKINDTDYAKAYQNWCSHEEVTKYVMWTKHKNELQTKELFDKWIKEYDDNTTYRWIIELKENHKVIGTIDVSKKLLAFDTCTIGYCISDKYWNQGIMTESLIRVIKYLFEECQAETICAEYAESNPASGKVMQKSGMKYEGTLRNRIIDKNNIRNDLISYSITKEEYKKNQG